MSSAQDLQNIDVCVFPLSIAETSETSEKCCITAIERTRPLEEGDMALSSSLDKKPVPEEPETAHSGSCLDKKPVPEEGKPLPSVSSLVIKSPAPEESGAVSSLLKNPTPENGTVSLLLKSPAPKQNGTDFLLLKFPTPEENSADSSLLKSHNPEETESASFSLNKSPAPEETESASFSFNKSPAPEETESASFSLNKSPAPEETESTSFSLNKSPAPEETESASFSLNKSPAPEEQPAHELKHTLKEEQDQNPLREDTKGTNHRTAIENSGNHTANPTDVTLANIKAHLDVIGQFIWLIPRFLHSVGCVALYITLLALQTLVSSSLLWALRQMKGNGKLVFVAVIFLCVGRISSAVGCYEGWFISKNLSSQTLLIRNHSFAGTFICSLSFPFTHRCPPLIAHMENMSTLRFQSENRDQYHVEYGEGPNGKSRVIEMKECAEILAPDSQTSLPTPGRNHFALIGAAILFLGVLLLIIFNFKRCCSRADASSSNDNVNATDLMEKGQVAENLKATTKENSPPVINGSSVKFFSKGTGSLYPGNILGRLSCVSDDTSVTDV